MELLGWFDGRGGGGGGGGGGAAVRRRTSGVFQIKTLMTTNVRTG